MRRCVPLPGQRTESASILEGPGPDVKVSLTKSGPSPIVLDAKLVAGKKDNVSVTIGTVNGVRVLQQIDLKSATLVFETQQTANQ